MAENSDHRKLTAILCADVKGYSRLMGEDESYTVGALKECRKVFAENIQKHAGRVVNAPGDSILAEFPSVVSAVQCAVEIQNHLNGRNADLPDNRKMVFRIGVNLGDVIQSEDAIYGDGVNIAARIEALAEPGGVSISSTVFNQVRNKLPYGYEYQGEHQVKNITNPVKVFKLLTAPEDAGKLVGMEPTVSASKWIWPTAVVAAVIVALIGFHVYQEIAGPKFEPASVGKMAYDLPDKPSIAVLPFDNLSGDPQQEYICDGLSEQIITSLSKVSGLFVIARNSSFSFKGKAVKVQQVAEQLGVRYVLEGSLQKSGDKVRITAQLIDAITGHHLWAETYDRELQDIFALQDEITIKILGSVGAELTTGERARVYAKGTNNLEAYIKVSKGYEHFERQGKEENILARKFAKEAIDLDPNYPSAWCLLGGTYLMDPFVGSTDSANPWDEAAKVFQKALELDETHAPSNGGLAFIYGCQRKYEKAFAQAQRGIELNPGTPISQVGFVLAMVGRYEEAVQYLKKAIRYDPKAPTFYYLGLGHAYRGLKQYDNAIAAYNKALERDPDYFMAHLYLTGTYYMAGREEEARAEAAEVLRLQPKFSVSKFAKALPYQDQDYRDRLVEGMLKAGLPENPPTPKPEKPTIAVLPFVNMSASSDQEYLSDGFTEQIITNLSMVPKLFVIARNSSFSFKGKPVKVQQIAEALKVRYVLEGSLQKSGKKLRINAQLIDATTGHHLWAEKYDRNLEDIFELQDEITLQIISAVGANLTRGERARLISKGTTNVEAYLKVLQGFEHYYGFNKEDNLMARKLAEEAIRLDPDYLNAKCLLAGTHMSETFLGTSISPEQSLDKAIEIFTEVLVTDEFHPIANAQLAYAYGLQRQFEKAINQAHRAIDLHPGVAIDNSIMASLLYWSGNYKEAFQYINRVISLDPKGPSHYYHILGNIYRGMGDYGNAIKAYKKAIERQPNYWMPHAFLAAAYNSIGKKEEAHSEAEEVLRINPNFSLDKLAKAFPNQDKEFINHVIEDMRQAGLK